ncbi:hypothetical protein GAH_00548 [Geoglobus ahangari]|uniref:Uncharacterized protein n=1 Tax=Geoglobus ahangari TaxID=113653 RepID=A0A0F7DC26_9EURY|nr:hypothetical protein [Geoglobus ahangari]AKG92106.1 hypothetical protein GAH_00548 [Geoglobus ahangari]
MYAVKNWNEEVIKWMAVGMVLAMVGMAVMPAVSIAESNASWYLSEVGLLYGVAKQDWVSVGLSAAGMALALAGLATATGGVGVAIAL